MPSSKGDFGGEKAPAQCTAMSKRSRERCKGPAIKGSPTQKCRMHGGKSKLGQKDPNFMHGRYSKCLPSQMLELYEDALSNPDLLEMADNIAVCDGMIREIFTRNKDGDPVPAWKDIADIVGEIGQLIKNPKSDRETLDNCVDRLNDMVEAGMRWDTAREKVVALMENQRKLVDTEVKRKKDLNQMIPIERVMILVSALSDVIKRNVRDKDARVKIEDEFGRIIGSPNTAGGSKKLGPNVMDVTPAVGIGGGRSREAIRRAKLKQKKEAMGKGVSDDGRPLSEL